MKRLITFQIVICLLFGSASASLVSYGFDCITNNNAASSSIGETQFSMDVTDQGVESNQVMFLFKNSGSNAAVISEIYFDDDAPALLSFQSFSNVMVMDVLSFSVGANPSNLPGGNTINFTSDYSYDPGNQAPLKGINPGEVLGIKFNILGGNSYADVINSLNTNDVRVGLHAIAFQGGFSESFVSTPNTPANVPEPSMAMMLLVGLGGMSFLGFRKK